MTLVRDIMSPNPLTVTADERITDIIGRLRRIGHEGYPVLQEGQIVGLLTARDMNRAAENDYAAQSVHDVMQAGQVIISPETHVSNLAAIMSESGWGQLPVVSAGELVGIVTRTDLISYYARRESHHKHDTRITHQQVAHVLGAPAASLIAFIAQQASQRGQTAYMVGGVVRDLLLQRPNLDIDFVLEGSAIALAKHLAVQFGGRIEMHEAFDTAKWFFDAQAAGHIGEALTDLPEYIDLVTARHEFYEGQAVLPTVYDSGIKLDLRRRDFTINALAVRLSAEGASGIVIDLFGGLNDLKSGVIRALHSLSFADDPTRTLRAVRFAHRLGFTIEPRTAALIQTALQAMPRITGERLRNELTLLLKEPNPENGLWQLQEMGVLSAIHPQFIFDARLKMVFRRAAQRPIDVLPQDYALYQWLIAATCLDSNVAADIGTRLVFRKSTVKLMQSTAKLVNQADELLYGTPSTVAFALEPFTLPAIQTAWRVLENPAHIKTLNAYLETWQHIKPTTTGNDLKQAGVPAGPKFGELLRALRAARLDGLISNDDEEKIYLQTLLESENTV